VPTGFDLTADDVLALHEDVMRRLGQAPAPLSRDGRALLEAALNRPRNAAFYSRADVFEQASVLTIGIAQAHAFLDGNKRTAAAALIVFLGLAGLTVRPGIGAEMEFARRLELILTEAAGERSQDVSGELANWLRAICDAL
jgi:death-on-curing protein